MVFSGFDGHCGSWKKQHAPGKGVAAARSPHPLCFSHVEKVRQDKGEDKGGRGRKLGEEGRWGCEATALKQGVEAQREGDVEAEGCEARGCGEHEGGCVQQRGSEQGACEANGVWSKGRK